MLDKASVSAEALAHVLDQSIDCVKLLGLDGTLRWMNSNGLCAMEIDDFASVAGQQWGSLWPDNMQKQIAESLVSASAGQDVKFDAFCPTAKGTPRWWSVTVTAVTGMDGQGAGFLSISRDVSEAENQRRALSIAAEEMRHRLRNTYAMVGSLLKGFARGNDGHEVFARDMQSRLIALSAAQSLSATEDMPCDVAALLPALIDPFITPHCTVSTDRIGDFSVPQGQADAIALVVGELAVNSAKHGALANGGSVAISAELVDGQIVIVWTEQSAIAVTATHRSGGQGLNLITRIVEIRRGTVDTNWQSHGPTVTLTFPRYDN
ncbi:MULTISPECIES: sensor histidine kinase [unclassified Yoonia]|uniref:sensor histidine kinase n=1 Tax=unclassified Yoonia TaxID=2629118 RepID=UPI002AFF9967|nr:MULTISPECIES: PAS domain-containing protein [unclassified Yoonia]